jgi:hypothetical protein
VKIRKQVYDLTLADFGRFPVWEFALEEEGEEGQDEATVRPYQFTPPLKPSNGMLVVLTDFTLADGTHMRGYITPPAQGASDVSMIQPVIVTEQGQVAFWYGILKPNAETIAENYHFLAKTASQVFQYGSNRRLRFRVALLKEHSMVFSTSKEIKLTPLEQGIRRSRVFDDCA